ncbi:MAG: ABC transporter permease, partial [Archangium sp.]|nr:ABC transporter permease [Archangium sp.]
MQVGIGGIDITQEPGFRSVVVLREGSLDGLTRPDSILIFEEQAEKLGAKVGDRMTISAPTPRGTNNTIDVTVVAVAASVGMLSSWNTFVNGQALRQLYQLNDETTGALQLYLKDLRQLKPVQERLRGVLTKAGYDLLDSDPRPFWLKFDSVNRESWTGQKLDVTNWEDESSFVNWMVKSFSALAAGVIFILVVIIAVGIMNVVWISIRERTREIGTLRAVGMQQRSVLAMFVAEGFLLGLAGTVSGALGGLAISAGLNAAHIQLPKTAQFIFMSDHLIVTPTVGWLAFGVFFITGIITAISVLPSFLAARLKPISAMSHVG